MIDRAFASRHPRDAAFFLAFVLFAWFAVVRGFSAVVTARFTGQAESPASLLLQVHVFAFVGWMCLLTVQILLVRGGRRSLHRQLGLVSALLVPVMLASGIGAEVQSQRSSGLTEDLQFFVTPLVEMLLFAGLVVAAFACRRDGSAHKRLILMATAFVLVAAFNRWYGDALEALVGAGFWAVVLRFFGGPNAVIVAGMAHDLATRGRVHRVYLFAVPVILAVELLAAAAWHDPRWPGIARWLIGL